MIPKATPSEVPVLPRARGTPRNLAPSRVSTHTRGMRLAQGSTLLLALLAAACTRAPQGTHEVHVFAAASLRVPFERLAQAYAELHQGGRVRLELGGSPTLVTRIESGAPCDVLATADLATMARAASAGALAPGRAKEFARNRLAIAVPRGNPRNVRGLADLGRDGLVLVLCAPTVPAGRYAREILTRAGVDARPRSEESSVQGVLAKLRLGEADAGIVYASDLLAAGGDVEGVAIPAEANTLATYPIAIARTSRQPDAARAFMELVLGARGQAILAEAGFAVRQ